MKTLDFKLFIGNKVYTPISFQKEENISSLFSMKVFLQLREDYPFDSLIGMAAELHEKTHSISLLGIISEYSLKKLHIDNLVNTTITIKPKIYPAIFQSNPKIYRNQIVPDLIKILLNTYDCNSIFHIQESLTPQ